MILEMKINETNKKNLKYSRTCKKIVVDIYDIREMFLKIVKLLTFDVTVM